MGDHDADLDDLRWHWGGAYGINYLGAAAGWMAQRRDDGAVLRADSAGQLHDAIAADYARSPVPRRDTPPE